MASLRAARAEEGEMDGAPPLSVVQVKGDTCRGPVVDVEAVERQTRSNPIKNVMEY